MNEEMKKAAHALDGIPVTAIYSNGREEDTTVAKAIGMGSLAEQARNEWAEVAKKLDYAFAEAGWFEKVSPEERKAASDHLAAVKPIERFNRVYKAYQKEQMFKRAEKRLVSLIKAELTNRKTAAIKEKCAKLERKTAKANALVNETMSQVTKSQQEAEALLAEHEAFMADAEKRINAMYARASDGWEQAAFQEARRVAIHSALEDRYRQEWLFKAGATNDPILRGVYMARAEGKEMSDDEV